MPPTLPGPESLADRRRALRKLAEQPLEFVREMAQTYGDIVHLRSHRGSLVFVNHPDFIREVLVTRAQSFRKADAVRDALRRFDGNSILVSEGETWREQRLLLQQGVRAEALEAYAKVTVKHTKEMLRHWPSVGWIDVVAEMSTLTMDTLADVVFGTQLPADMVDAIRVTLDARAAEAAKALSLTDPQPFHLDQRRDEALRRIDAFLRDLIQQRRRGRVSRGDLLSMLAHKGDDEAPGRDMERADQSIRDETIGMINASQDTTAAALVWTLYLVAEHDAIQERLREEIQRCAVDGASACWDVGRLPFAKMVVQESLRLYPPNWMLMVRRCVDETAIGGYQIPTGCELCICPYVVHRDSRWFSSPERFDPDRFARHAEDATMKSRYLPFGIGPHVCIGNTLTIMMLTLILGKVLGAYQLELGADQPEVRPEAGIVIRPKGGLQLTVTRYS